MCRCVCSLVLFADCKPPKAQSMPTGVRCFDSLHPGNGISNLFPLGGRGDLMTECLSKPCDSRVFAIPSPFYSFQAGAGLAVNWVLTFGSTMRQAWFVPVCLQSECCLRTANRQSSTKHDCRIPGDDHPYCLSP